MKRIVQITAHGEGENSYACVYALLDDGTLWLYPVKGDADWTQLPSPGGRGNRPKTAPTKRA